MLLEHEANLSVLKEDEATKCLLWEHRALVSLELFDREIALLEVASTNDRKIVQLVLLRQKTRFMKDEEKHDLA